MKYAILAVAGIGVLVGKIVSIVAGAYVWLLSSISRLLIRPFTC